MRKYLPEIKKKSCLSLTCQKYKRAHGKKRVEKGFSSYTVVSAVYNVEKYLHDFFISMVRQTLDFEKNIHLIMVDDGSTDRSAEIIKTWQKRYPGNITYLYKENGGQASARNMGLPLVKNEWVTFTDPDDFLDENYFLEVDQKIKAYTDKNIVMVACHLVFFFEKNRSKSDTHSLNYKFNKENLISIENLNNFIQLNVSSAFMKRDLLGDIHFDVNMKPNGEDALFVLMYFNSLKSGNVLFLPQAIFYYRKRSAQNSTLDLAWSKKTKYSSVLLGYYKAALLQLSKQKFISHYLQAVVLYETCWYLISLINNDNRLHHLSQEEKKFFVSLLKYLIELIDIRTIYSFKHKPLWNYYRIVFLQHFKDKEPYFYAFYIENQSIINKTFDIFYYSNYDIYIKIIQDNKEIYPVSFKKKVYTFVDKEIIYQYRYRFFVKNIKEDKKIKIQSNVSDVAISCGEKWISGNAIAQKDIWPEIEHPVGDPYKDCWLFMDRNIQADDNAEHLYRYIKKGDLKTDIYFLLERDSHDWNRLVQEGFNLIVFGSEEHKRAHRGCSTIISSHADPYIYNFFNDDLYKNKKIVFLQHGVTKDDLSNWLGSKKIDLFITSTPQEFYSLASNNNKYKFSYKDVLLSGFPRHDRLLDLQESIPSKKQIVIMPTWRAKLSGTPLRGNTREKNPDFMQSLYATSWKKFLHSEELKQLCNKFNYEVLFFPHANTQPYIDAFEVPEWIQCLTHRSGGIQELFCRSALMITDYSSVAFEMAYLCKPVIYFQFDREDVFGGGHLTQKGYFDYKKDGFGPVVETQEELIKQIEVLLANGGKPSPGYRRRMERTFSFRDKRCCERVYNAIRNLEDPQPDYFSEISSLHDYAINASKHHQILSSIERWKAFYDISSEEGQAEMYLWLGRMYLSAGKYAEFCELYTFCNQIQSIRYKIKFLYPEYCSAIKFNLYNEA